MAADLVGMGHCLLRTKMLDIYCVIDGFTKYPWVKPLKDKKRKTFLIAFIEAISETN